MEENKICPILTAGAFANKFNKKGDVISCFEEDCKMWDFRKEMCGLCRVEESKNEKD